MSEEKPKPQFSKSFQLLAEFCLDKTEAGQAEKKVEKHDESL